MVSHSIKPLTGVLVVAIEQAVAAPYCTARLCEAGARVIKIERATGDFSRGYDSVAGGDSSYFLWTNLGKESVVLDFKQPDDASLLNRILSRADVFVQNLAPGAMQRAGLDSQTLRTEYPRLITCSISGYGSSPEVEGMKAYDLLVQAESGLVSVSGGQGDPGRIGVSICDITAGMNAHAGILEALLLREKTGCGSSIEVSLFGTAADLMSVPLLHYDYGGTIPANMGLNHPSIAPYGGYATSEGATIIVAVQNEREWKRFCEVVLEAPHLAADPRLDTNRSRVANRKQLDETILGVSRSLTRDQFIARLTAADIAHGAVNDVAALSRHPALLRRTGLSSEGQEINLPLRPIVNREGDEDAALPRAPSLGEHTSAVRNEFL